MLKVAFSGQANSGKDTAAKLLMEKYGGAFGTKNDVVCSAALADPIKEMVMIMFPRTDRDILYGSSQKRASVVPGAQLNGEPLTYRKLLQNLGTEVGRSYKETVWLDALDYKIEEAEKRGVELFVVTDVRFKNEFEHLKAIGFNMIRVKRGEQPVMDHASEKEQELLSDSEFDFIVNNTSTLEDLGVQMQELLTYM